MHAGPYHQLGQTYAALDAWMRERELTRAGPPWEVCLNDPQPVPPDEYRTALIQPIAPADGYADGALVEVVDGGTVVVVVVAPPGGVPARIAFACSVFARASSTFALNVARSPLRSAASASA